MRVRILASLALLLISSLGYAQYGGQLVAVAGSDQLTVGEALWLVGSASSSIRPGVEISGARTALSGLSIRLPSDSDDRPVSLGQYSRLIVQFFDIQGGFWYGLFPGPLTALRVLQSLGIVPDDANAAERLSGAEAINILRRHLLMTESGTGESDG